ncbi:4Fe-4S dicluster domain-containing protein [candidate division KSB1 bacterium]|nr:4Fe-4S dicluster domain-containing protein [candidate division KSB1 bacterium]
MDGNYLMPLPAIASDAGLGEVGRLGYLIHPRYGARIRLGAVTTDMPLAADSSILFGVQDFCRICLKCATHCPAGAISFGEEKQVRGVCKWSTNQEACYKYWRSIGTDCGICMRVCPFSKPNNMVHSVIRTFIRRNVISRQIAVWGDKLLYDYRTVKGNKKH